MAWYLVKHRDFIFLYFYLRNGRQVIVLLNGIIRANEVYIHGPRVGTQSIDILLNVSVGNWRQWLQTYIQKDEPFCNISA